MKLSQNTQKSLQSLVEKSVEGADDLPGTTVVVVSKDGSELFVGSAGKRGIASTEDMTPDNIYWIASCTKMLTGLSCMQLVEKGILSLDDGDQLETFCPELKTVKVLDKNGNLVEKNKKITLRMLLSHTAGFGYSFFNQQLRNHGYPAGVDEFSGNMHDILQPLVNQPGEAWEYGTNIDWAGIALERATGVRLNDYFQTNICKPLGLENLNMFPNDSMRSKLAFMHQRLPSGKLIQRDHLLRRPLTVQNEKDNKDVLQSGGAGLFAKPQEYARVISVLLNDGTCPKTGAKLLSKSTVDEMFTNQIPQLPQFGRNGIADAKPDLTNPLADLYPEDGSPPQGWGLTFMLNGGPTGRSKATGWWAGLANLFWWADRENGVGGIICSQILPFGDAKVLGLWFGIEGAVYGDLKVPDANILKLNE